MDTIVKVLGSIVLTAISMAIPILLTLGFVYEWVPFFMMWLIILTACEAIMLGVSIYAEVE